jgi:hypothetical protein
MEEWRDVKGWEGIYQVSSHGRLKSFKKDPSGRILSNVNQNGDYFSVVLCQGNRVPRYVRMHILVAEAFIPNPLGKPEINHIDLNKQNNRAENLEWVDRRENYDHAVQNGVDFWSGMNHYNQCVRPKPVLQIRPDGKVLRKFNNCIEAARATGVCSRDIHLVASRTEYKPGLTRRQAGGFVWRFYGD